MRILFLLPEFPYPPSTGGRSKVFNELSYLSTSHKCDLLCFGVRDEVSIKALVDKLPNVTVCDVIALPSGIERWMKVVWSLMRLLPPSFAKYVSEEYASALSKVLCSQDYDVVHYDIINMAQYLPVAKDIASVHSPNDATSLSYTRMAEQESRISKKLWLLISSMLLKRFEKKYYPLFTKVHVVSPIDENYLNEVNSEIDIDVIPITIDGAFLNKYDNSSGHVENDRSNKTIVCTGNFGNSSIARGLEAFLTDGYPFILHALPKVRVLILGQNADESLIMLMKNLENVEFVTWVDSYRDFLVQADVVLAPDLAGTGIKTRVIQAMGLGLPVVGTKIAYEGIPIINHMHGEIYNSPSDCAEYMLALFADDRKYTIMSNEAHLLAMREFALSAVGPKYEKLYIDAINKLKKSNYIS